MYISTRHDLLKAASLIASGKLDADSIMFADFITDSIKIDSKEWSDAKLLDIKIAQLMLSIQKDTIGIYNSSLDENVTIKKLADYPFLMLKFTIQEGCIDFTKILNGEAFKQFLGNYDKMNSKNKLITGLILCCMIGVYRSPEIISAIKESPEMARVMETSEVKQIIAENQRTEEVLVEYIGEGKVSLNSGQAINQEELRQTLIKMERVPDPVPVLVDDEFKINKYDFDKQQAYITHETGIHFWASTEWLPSEKRVLLRDLTAGAIEDKSTAKAFLNLSIKLAENKIIAANIDSIEMPKRTFSKTLKETISIPPVTVQPQASLF